MPKVIKDRQVKDRNLNIAVTENERLFLKNYSEENDISISFLFRAALNEYFEKQGIDFKQIGKIK